MLLTSIQQLMSDIQMVCSQKMGAAPARNSEGVSSVCYGICVGLNAENTSAWAVSTLIICFSANYVAVLRIVDNIYQLFDMPGVSSSHPSPCFGDGKECWARSTLIGLYICNLTEVEFANIDDYRAEACWKTLGSARNIPPVVKRCMARTVFESGGIYNLHIPCCPWGFLENEYSAEVASV